MQAMASGQGPGEGFLGSLIRSATSTDAQIFTEASAPFKICHANNAWTQVCGFTVAEVLGKTCKILQGPETSAESVRELHAGLAAQKRTTVKLTNYTKRGEKFLNELTVEPLRNEGGEVSHFVGTLRPLTLPASMPEGAAPLKPVDIPQGSLTQNVGGPLSGGASTAGGAGASCGGSSFAGAQGRAAAQTSPSEFPDILSRSSFPLHTLNHHPNAPVLLRMLQLNNCSLRRSSFAGGGGGFGDERGGVGSLGAGGPSSLGMGMMPPGGGLQGSSFDPTVSAMLLGQGRVAGGSGAPSPRDSSLAGGAGSSSLPQASPRDSYQNHDRFGDERKSDAFLAAVAGQGVLPMGSWPKQPDESPLTSPQAGASSRAAAPQQGSCSCSSQGVFACGGVPGGRGHGHGQQGQTRPEQVLPLANRKRACDAGGRPLAPDAWDRESLSRQNEMQLRSPEQGSFSVGGCGGGGGSSSSRLDDAARHFGGGGGPLTQGGLGGGLGRPPGHGMAGLSSGEAAAAHEFVASLQSGDGGGMSVALPHGLGGSHSVHEQLRSHLQNAAQRLGGADGRGGADEHGDSQPSRRAVSGGPGVGGQWGAAATTLGNGEEVIELDDIFDVLDNWDEFERQPELVGGGTGPDAGPEQDPSSSDDRHGGS